LGEGGCLLANFSFLFCFLNSNNLIALNFAVNNFLFEYKKKNKKEKFANKHPPSPKKKIQTNK
jgi:hypothetical protein